MIRKEDFERILDETEIPWTNGRMEEREDTEFPYICYTIPSDNTFWADGIRYFYSARISVALYTDHPEDDSGKRLEEILTKHEIGFERNGSYISKPIDCYETIYEMEV